MRLQTLIRLLYAKHFVNRTMHSDKNFTTYDEYVVQADRPSLHFDDGRERMCALLDMLNRCLDAIVVRRLMSDWPRLPFLQHSVAGMFDKAGRDIALMT